jgi:hypothetical protein
MAVCQKQRTQKLPLCRDTKFRPNPAEVLCFMKITKWKSISDWKPATYTLDQLVDFFSAYPYWLPADLQQQIFVTLQKQDVPARYRSGGWFLQDDGGYDKYFGHTIRLDEVPSIIFQHAPEVASQQLRFNPDSLTELNE